MRGGSTSLDSSSSFGHNFQDVFNFYLGAKVLPGNISASA